MRKIKFISILLVLSMLLTVPAFAFSTGFTDVSENPRVQYGTAENASKTSAPSQQQPIGKNPMG